MTSPESYFLKLKYSKPLFCRGNSWSVGKWIRYSKWDIFFKMRKMFEKFPEVLLIDATYKQIKLRLPYIFPWNRFLNRNCIPALSLSGNPNFSLLLPNPGNRNQCQRWKVRAFTDSVGQVRCFLRALYI
jgi:hypothetical protein